MPDLPEAWKSYLREKYSAASVRAWRPKGLLFVNENTLLVGEAPGWLEEKWGVRAVRIQLAECTEQGYGPRKEAFQGALQAAQKAWRADFLSLAVNQEDHALWHAAEELGFRFVEWVAEMAFPLRTPLYGSDEPPADLVPWEEVPWEEIQEFLVRVQFQGHLHRDPRIPRPAADAITFAYVRSLHGRVPGVLARRKGWCGLLVGDRRRLPSTRHPAYGLLVGALERGLPDRTAIFTAMLEFLAQTLKSRRGVFVVRVPLIQAEDYALLLRAQPEEVRYQGVLHLL